MIAARPQRTTTDPYAVTVPEGPVFPLRVPARLPDTRLPTERYAAQHAQDDRRARELRVRLFRAMWLRDLDISTGAALDALDIAGPRAPRVAPQWQREWEEFHDPTVPLVVTSTGAMHRGSSHWTSCSRCGCVTEAGATPLRGASRRRTTPSPVTAHVLRGAANWTRCRTPSGLRAVWLGSDVAGTVGGRGHRRRDPSVGNGGRA